mmetsp:Transcript_180/g.517  ORF Transcript_180/g.517 Transcript_180/m.517 type:complete len:332 (+) Transcript_180:245-1240(+)
MTYASLMRPRRRRDDRRCSACFHILLISFRASSWFHAASRALLRNSIMDTAFSEALPSARACPCCSNRWWVAKIWKRMSTGGCSASVLRSALRASAYDRLLYMRKEVWCMESWLDQGNSTMPRRKTRSARRSTVLETLCRKRKKRTTTSMSLANSSPAPRAAELRARVVLVRGMKEPPSSLGSPCSNAVSASGPSPTMSSDACAATDEATGEGAGEEAALSALPAPPSESVVAIVIVGGGNAPPWRDAGAGVVVDVASLAPSPPSPPPPPPSLRLRTDWVGGPATTRPRDAPSEAEDSQRRPPLPARPPLPRTLVDGLRDAGTGDWVGTCS